jgi:ribulose 1,5-bisphosphate carboxylase large subunit-like protein
MELSPQIKIILGDQQPAVIGAAWNHPDGPAAGVKAMNEGILKF